MPAASGASRTAGAGSVSEEFTRLIDGFRHRLDREIAAFLAAKRSPAEGVEGVAGVASVGEDDADDDANGAEAGAHGPGGGHIAGVADGAAAPGAAAGAGDLAASSRRHGTLADPGDLVDGVARLMAQGGKRLRPALVYYTYRACGGRSEQQVIPLALATEFLHTYLLIHDDIMDHAEMRRGQPAAHARFRDLHRAAGLRGDADDFGRSVGILLGDLAHTYAVELFTGVAVGPGPAAAELNRCFSWMCEEVIGGQYLEFLLAHRDHPEPAATDLADLHPGTPDAHRANDANAASNAADAPTLAQAVREAELLRVLRLKSGRYTAERPIQLGALLAGAPPELRAELSRYGTAVGEAFQLQDDLLGLFGDPATVGKPVGDDLREGKFTLLIHHALVKGSPADRQLVAGALGDPNLTAVEVAQVQLALERTGARRAVTAMIAERLGEARRALERLAPLLAAPAPRGTDPDASEGMRFLGGLLDFLWEREQ
jgi:geranylgeranyl diphosphate synthase, type I